MITAINEVTYTPTPIEINGALPIIVLALITLAIVAATTYWSISNRHAPTETTTDPTLTSEPH